jgi:uncharacterized protein (DUF983 family)
VDVDSRQRTRLFVIWYLCISAGFALLGIRALVLRAPLWAAVLRWIIAAAFLVMALLQRREDGR